MALSARTLIRATSRAVLVAIGIVVILVQLHKETLDIRGAQNAILKTRDSLMDSSQGVVGKWYTFEGAVPRNYNLAENEKNEECVDENETVDNSTGDSTNSTNVDTASKDGTKNFTTIEDLMDSSGLQEKGTEDIVSYRPDYCWPRGQIESANCNFGTIENFNSIVFPLVHNLVNTSLFRFWKVTLDRECPFWQSDSQCMLRDCTVITADESEIPEEWRMSSLSSIKLTNNLFQSKKDPYCNLKDSDFCYVDGDMDSSDGTFVDLVRNPERFTGYGGESAHRIWNAVYEENCFKMDLLPSLSDSNLFKPDNICVEKRSFYRLLSGMHTSISIHICNEWLDRTTGVWGRNMTCFEERFKDHKDHIENLYFAYVIMLRSISKLVPFLSSSRMNSMCPTDITDMDSTLSLISQISEVFLLPEATNAFDEKVLFKTPDTQYLLDEMKIHFRNISMIMDCVECDKCRLWGKVQVTGIGTALKILFSFADDIVPTVSRSELVALFNTFHRLSESLFALFNLSKTNSDDSGSIHYSPAKKLNDVFTASEDKSALFGI